MHTLAIDALLRYYRLRLLAPNDRLVHQSLRNLPDRVQLLGAEPVLLGLRPCFLPEIFIRPVVQRLLYRARCLVNLVCGNPHATRHFLDRDAVHVPVVLVVPLLVVDHNQKGHSSHGFEVFVLEVMRVVEQESPVLHLDFLLQRFGLPVVAREVGNRLLAIIEFFFEGSPALGVVLLEHIDDGGFECLLFALECSHTGLFTTLILVLMQIDLNSSWEATSFSKVIFPRSMTRLLQLLDLQ